VIHLFCLIILKRSNLSERNKNEEEERERGKQKSKKIQIHESLFQDSTVGKVVMTVMLVMMMMLLLLLMIVVEWLRHERDC